MRRLLTVSALFALTLFATAAIGQPPSGNSKSQPGAKKAEKKADPTDAAIAAALAHDPDVLMAKAKIQLAEAELAKARLAVTQKVLAARSAVQDARTAVIVAEQGLEALVKLYKAERIPAPDYETRSDYKLALVKIEAAKAKLATAEAELKLLTGGAGAAGANAEQPHDKAVESALMWLSRNARTAPNASATLLQYLRAAQGLTAVQGPIPDRIRAALDKPVKLGAKGELVTFRTALEVFKKEAGLDVPVRGSFPLRRPDRPNQIVSEGEELPVGAWLQLFQDECGGTFYVREYGLLIANRQSAPPDAPTLTEFWKQKPAKEVKPESKN